MATNLPALASSYEGACRNAMKTSTFRSATISRVCPSVLVALHMETLS
jgi:hypothetical protein